MENVFTTFWNRNKIIFKSFLIGFLILLLLIPTFFIRQLVSERQQRQREAVAEVSSKWAGSQTIAGLVIGIPYTETITDKDNTIKEIKKWAYFFNGAYLIASLATIGLISWYVKSILQSSKMSLFIACLLTVLYGFIFTLIQLQDYALLMGSVGLFIALAVVMYFSRKIKWN